MRMVSIPRCSLALVLLATAAVHGANVDGPARPDANVQGADSIRIETRAWQPRFLVHGVDQGLPSTQIRTLLQDSEGLLWIGTYGGLSSFDGRQFREHLAPDDPRPLVVESLIEDRQRRLWATAERRGVYRIEADRHTWTRYSSTQDPPRQLRSDDIWAFLNDPSGGLWLGGYRGGLQYIDAAGVAHGDEHPQVPALASDQITALVLDADQRLWIGTGDQGVWLREPVDARNPAQADRVRPCQAEGGVLTLAPTATGVQVAWTDGRIEQLTHRCESAQPVYRMTRSDLTPQSTLIQTSQSMAFGLRQGLAWQPPGETSLLHLQHRPGVTGSPPPGIGQALLPDREGGLWVGVFGGGLAWLAPDAHQMMYLPYDGGHSGGLRGRSVRGLALAPDHSLWVGSQDGGLERVDPQLQQVSSWNPPPGRVQGRFSVRALAHWGDALWVAHREALWRMPWHGEQPGPLQVVDLAGVHLLEPAAGELWAAARGDALYRLDAQGRVLGRYVPGQLAGDEIQQLIVDPQDTLWVASDGGLQRYDATRDRFDFVPGFSAGDVASACFTATHVWRYADAGLERHRLGDHHREVRLDREAGIPALDTAYLQCREPYLWLLARNEVLALDMRTDQVVLRWGQGDGLPPVELGRSNFGLTHLGRWWTGGEGGLVALDLQVPTSVKPSFQVRMRAARIQREANWLDLAGPHLELQAADRNLHLDAAATLYRNPQQTRYSYRLEGPEGLQRYHSDSGALELARLPAGNYQLSVQATHPQLGESLAGAQWSVRVHPYWYQTGWARWTALVLLLGMVWLTIARQQRALQARHARQLAAERLAFVERLAEEKSRFLAQSSHEMKNLLGGASGTADLIAARAESTETRGHARRLAELCADLSRLLDDLLENARLEQGQIRLQPVDFDLLELARECVTAYQTRAAEKGLVLRLVTPKGVAWRHGDPLRLRQILHNLLGNAVKYTDAGEVRLSLDIADPQSCALHVTDSGPGIEPGLRERLFEPFALGRNRRDSTGLGLWICRQLSELCGGQIAVHAESGGTRFAVRLPWPQVRAATTVGRVLVIGDDRIQSEWQAAGAAFGIEVGGVETPLGVVAHPWLAAEISLPTWLLLPDPALRATAQALYCSTGLSPRWLEWRADLSATDQLQALAQSR